MKHSLLRALGFAACATMAMGLASAAALCSTGGSSTDGTILSGDLTQGATLSSDFSCSIGASTFSNFSLFGNIITTEIPTFSLNETSVDNGIRFGFNNLGSDDIELRFQIDPGITGITLGGGTTSAVTERVCSVAFDELGDCTGTVLATLTSTNGSVVFSTVGLSDTDFVLKDISGGSNLSQTIVPEPVTFSLIGFGLVGLGIMRRRRAGK